MSSYEACYEQLALFTSRPSIPQLPTPKHDPYWDEITKKSAPEHIEEKWNPDDFGGTSFKAEGDQLTIFHDDLQEPPEPDDFNSIEEFEKAWSAWESVREQVKNASQLPTPEHIDNNSSDVTAITSQSLTTGVREQVTQAFEVAPEHSDNNSSLVAYETPHLLDTGVREQTIQGVEVAHEHIDTNNKGVAITTTPLLDTGVREQLPNNFVNGCNGHQQPTQKQPAQWVEEYWVKSASKKHWYYRYCYMSGRKQHRTHIGSTSSKAAIQKRADVLWMIADDVAPEEIISYLKQEKEN